MVSLVRIPSEIRLSCYCYCCYSDSLNTRDDQHFDHEIRFL